ncbi:hypothetical protein [Mesorhizobium sp. M0977]|uniref:hypothetical protein n=1 Tax=Mesorhizobium sp. M0977 TaxID=2957039 RepID=UPI003339DE82
MADMPAKRDIGVLFKVAEAAGKVGIARKTKAIDARMAKPGEIIVTYITGDGKETQSRPADAGDMVVRNRCPETGNEQYLVSSKKFVARYEEPHGKPDADGWSEYRPLAPEMLYFIVDKTEGDFVFTAPWGEEMVAKPGDAIIRNPDDPADTYRVAAKSFKCTYEIVKGVR